MGISIIRFARHRPRTFCYSSLGVSGIYGVRNIDSGYGIKSGSRTLRTSRSTCTVVGCLYSTYLQYLRYIRRRRRIRKALHTKYFVVPYPTRFLRQPSLSSNQQSNTPTRPQRTKENATARVLYYMRTLLPTSHCCFDRLAPQIMFPSSCLPLSLDLSSSNQLCKWLRRNVLREKPRRNNIGPVSCGKKYICSVHLDDHVIVAPESLKQPPRGDVDVVGMRDTGTGPIASQAAER